MFFVYAALSLWAAGLLVMFVRGWHFRSKVLNNLSPDANAVDIAALAWHDPSRLNATGMKFRLKMVRLQQIAAAWFIGGLFAIWAIASITR